MHLPHGAQRLVYPAECRHHRIPYRFDHRPVMCADCLHQNRERVPHERIGGGVPPCRDRGRLNPRRSVNKTTCEPTEKVSIPAIVGYCLDSQSKGDRLGGMALKLQPIV
jgi:hypothetical protein